MRSISTTTRCCHKLGSENEVTAGWLREDGHTSTGHAGFSRGFWFWWRFYNYSYSRWSLHDEKENKKDEHMNVLETVNLIDTSKANDNLKQKRKQHQWLQRDWWKHNRAQRTLVLLLALLFLKPKTIPTKMVTYSLMKLDKQWIRQTTFRRCWGR